tara:strand:+ start:2295 stop:2627 length:333 start_codon:yes stop_codon:yes gene_type:complete
MPSIYQNVVKTLTGTSITDIYECPQGSTAILKTISGLNTNGSNAAALTLHIYDSSADATFEFQTGSIAASTRIGYLKDGEVIVLESKDKIRMTAATANYFDIFVSLLEIT